MRVVIIGGDAAGMSAAAQVRRRQPDWEVVVFERGVYTSYASCGIPYWFAGDVEKFEDLQVVTPDEFRNKRGVDVRTEHEVIGIDTAAHTVTVRNAAGETSQLDWDRLLVATGAKAIVPPWDGVDLEGVSTLKNLADASRVEALLARNPRRCVVIGAGYIGLEAAEAFRRRGLDVTVVEKLAGVMGGVEEKITELVREEMLGHDVDLRLETTVEGFVGDGARLSGVTTDAGLLEADLAIIALGVKPEAALAADSGIALGASGAIAVDERQQTSAPDVYAAGDCAEAFHRVLGKPAWVPLALTANRAGRVAGASLCGDEDRFPGIVGSAVTRVFDLTIARTGIDAATAETEGIDFVSTEVIAPNRAHYFQPNAPLWVKLIHGEADGRLLGAWLVGRDPSAGKRADVLATAISAGMSIDDVADLDLTYAPPFAPVWDPILQAANRARLKRR
jgi:NADPH-dependent 2,4-dienoyl-CoA reductase/sulfur reductase-like enzyme